MIEEYAVLAAKLHNSSLPDTLPMICEKNRELFAEACRAIDVLNAPSRNDFADYQHAQTATALARSEYNRASINLELEKVRERCAELMSQAEPVVSLDIDREKVRQLLNYVLCGRLK